ncbi:MAG: DUF1573 domain-containing protein [Planctomycetaceae bacterium]|jgi:hypothetical protein|nr:DUF1573 domain-containing protein [Planctomycetaceae bacterium]
MSKNFLFVLTLFFCQLFFVSCNSSQSINPGGVYVTPTILDLGDTIDKESIEGNFKIVNATDKPVSIINVNLFCGCSDLILSDKTILANSFVDAKLAVDVKDRYGHNMFEAEVFTDELTTPIIKFRLIANIITKHLEGTIPFDLGKFESGDKIDLSFTTLPGKVKSVSVENIRCTPQLFSDSKIEISAKPTLEDNVKIDVKGTIPVYEGNFYIDVDLKSEEAFWNNAHLRFSGNVHKSISVPATVYLGFLDKGNSSETEVNFICQSDFFQKNQIDRIVILSQLPENLTVTLVKKTRPSLLFSIQHSEETKTFSRDIEIEIYLSNGKIYLLTTNVAARFL